MIRLLRLFRRDPRKPAYRAWCEARAKSDTRGMAKAAKINAAIVRAALEMTRPPN